MLANKDVSRIALGTVQFGQAYGLSNSTGQSTSFDEIESTLDLARCAGIDTLDTAISYGNAETLLGRCNLYGFQIVTKLPGLPEGTKDLSGWVEDQTVQSLRRLGVGSLKAVLLHRPDDLFGPSGGALATALCRLIDQRLTRQIGVSVHSCLQLDRCLAALPVTLAQLPFNVFDNTLSDRAAGFAMAGVELHTRSAFLQGLLLMPRVKQNAYFDRWAPQLETWQAWLAEHSLSPTDACLNFVRSCAEIDRIVVGVQTRSQLEELLSIQPRLLPQLPQWARTDAEDLVNPARWKLK
jgi:aryl-alcohol dehydrogenase-like predicted oxidoreductase